MGMMATVFKTKTEGQKGNFVHVPILVKSLAVIFERSVPIQVRKRGRREETNGHCKFALAFAIAAFFFFNSLSLLLRNALLESHRDKVLVNFVSFFRF